jgi:hypothetical protein
MNYYTKPNSLCNTNPMNQLWEMKFSFLTIDFRHEEPRLPLSNVLEARTLHINESIFVVLPR